MDENIRIVSKQPIRLYYFVPFYFDENRFDEINQAFHSSVQSNNNQWKKTIYPFNDYQNSIYDHVISVFNNSNDRNCLCRTWKYLPAIPCNYLIKINESESVSFSMAEIHSHLFKSGVGFLSYQLVIDNDQIQTSGQLLRFQQKAKELARTKLSFVNDCSEEIDESRNQKVSLSNVIHSLLFGTCTDISFFGNHEDCRFPRKALLFSFLCYNCENTNNLREMTVHLATGYNKQNLQTVDTITSCKSTADNILFYVSQHGCAISVHRLDESNMRFFLDNPPVQYYHLLYLFSLYQHYSLLSFSMRITRDFPSDTQAYRNNHDYADKMQDYICDLNTFLMKSDVATVSVEPYHNIFYSACREALSIEEDKLSIRSGFESLVSMQQNMQITRQKEIWHEQENQYRRDQKKQEEFNTQINFFAIMLSALAFFPEFVNFINRIAILICKGPESLELADWIYIVLFCIIVLIIIGLIINLRRKNSRHIRT